MDNQVRNGLSQDRVGFRPFSREGQGFAAEVWKTVEDFILDLTENPFIDSDYSDSP